MNMKKVWNGWLRERKHNKCFTDRMKKIDKKCVDEIEKNKHLTGGGIRDIIQVISGSSCSQSTELHTTNINLNPIERLQVSMT